MEFAKEPHRTRRRENDLDHHFPLGGDVHVQVLVGEADIVQRPGLILDFEREPLARRPLQKCRLKVILVSLELDRLLAFHRQGAVVGDRHRALRGRLRCRGWCRALTYRARLYYNLARSVAHLDGGGHRATGHIHDGDVLRALIADEGRAPIRTDGEPMGVGADPYGTADRVARRVKEVEGPWPLTDHEAGAAVWEHHDNVG